MSNDRLPPGLRDSQYRNWEIGPCKYEPRPRLLSDRPSEVIRALVRDNLVRLWAHPHEFASIAGTAGLRHTEAATLRWRQYDATLEPLGALNLEKTKSGVPRRIPVHPMLARALAEWKLSGWERTYGRRPEADDVIVPTRNLTERPSPDSQRSLGLDLDLLRLRRRRGHDLRRTFVTLAQVDGARRDLLETITHGPRGDIINVYSSFPWPALCAEVAKLKIDVRAGQVIEADFATSFATTQESARRRWGKNATPAGFEPEVEPNRFADLQKSPAKLRVPLGSG